MPVRAFTAAIAAPLAGFLLVLFSVTGTARAEAPITPENAAGFMESLAVETLDVLGDGATTEGEKTERLKTIVDRSFDLPRISRFVLGRFWRSATEAQRREYQDLFRRGVVDFYTRALVTHGGTGFKVLDSARVSETDVLVNSRLERSNGPPIGAGWRVRLIDGAPKIIDVTHEGVSLALTQRQEYSSVIERQGLEGLLALLRERG